ncbi:DNA-directed RNA polymerase [Sulfodiicoccus acidiphilus]|uniref:DNA-directed RNA polymerase subunit Rpo7 n=1 Tax=Sulfodiicoccus acidiphilus TaxID=1670455 RepID=A0A348B198_9CREN|nr:DNA-directed RNA polymerase [Sulfodiicoccus acidiphilus]BBD71950.1 DNA-directed RNA polymerase [Sulfodiicoccus acidiphilus]GGT91695.1 DNA-directed RNA polymerase [Sulfodiicoccus acidiphilus]
MFKLVKAKGIVRISPEFFGEPLEQTVLESLRQEYQERLIKDLGLVLAVMDVKVSEEGRIILGDGATYHDVEFQLLTFVPVPQEVVEGEVVQTDNIGIYVNIGPMDGLVHISQIADENLKYDPNRGILVGERTKRIIEGGDKVRARIVSISAPSAGRLPRIGLTMRQPYLGKIEWIEKEVTKVTK